jgi:hypothetical protein
VNLFVSIDQLGNVLAGGNPDNTISSRVGYYTEKYYDSNKVPFKWRTLRNIINFTFYPVDGKNHCKEAYFNDAGEEFDKGTSDIAVAFLAILIIISCIFISILLYLLFAFGIVSPRKINRSKNIKQRLRIAEAKLKGVHSELNEYKVKVDEELDEIIDETQNTIEEIIEKVDGILNLKKRLSNFKRKK